MYNRKGMTLVELIVVISVVCLVILMALVMLSPVLSNGPKLHPRLVCGTNLKGMANALNVYAFDYRDEYPIQGAGTHTWGTTTTDWDDPEKDWENSDGTLTVASSLYLLVREADVGVKSFICSKSDQQPFVNDTDYDVVELWDFGPSPTEHQSYSYQLPYKGALGYFPADGTSSPGNAVMADRNPWFDEKLTASSIEKETAETFVDKVSLIDILVDTDKWKYQIGNSQPHGREGQNVLFNDGHVSFMKRPDVGTRYDNIYTRVKKSNGKETEEHRRKGGASNIEKNGARNREDSLLVNDRKKHAAPASSRQL